MRLKQWKAFCCFMASHIFLRQAWRQFCLNEVFSEGVGWFTSCIRAECWSVRGDGGRKTGLFFLTAEKC